MSSNGFFSGLALDIKNDSDKQKKKRKVRRRALGQKQLENREAEDNRRGRGLRSSGSASLLSGRPESVTGSTLLG